MPQVWGQPRLQKGEETLSPKIIKKKKGARGWFGDGALQSLMTEKETTSLLPSTQATAHTREGTLKMLPKQ